MERIFILDKSGSMHDCLSDTIGGFNSFLETQKSIGGTMSLYLFNDTLEELYKEKKIEDVQNISRDEFVPYGGTALYDAIGKVLTSHRLGENSTVVILTDGHENSSKMYTRQVIRDLIKMNEDAGVRFLFLAAHESAFDGADDIGLQRRDAMNYRAEIESPIAFEMLATCLRNRSQGEDTPLSNSNTQQTKPRRGMEP